MMVTQSAIRHGQVLSFVTTTKSRVFLFRLRVCWSVAFMRISFKDPSDLFACFDWALAGYVI